MTDYKSCFPESVDPLSTLRIRTRSERLNELLPSANPWFTSSGSGHVRRIIAQAFARFYHVDEAPFTDSGNATKGGHGGPPLHLRLMKVDTLDVNVGVALRGHPSPKITQTMISFHCRRGLRMVESHTRQILACLALFCFVFKALRRNSKSCPSGRRSTQTRSSLRLTGAHVK